MYARDISCKGRYFNVYAPWTGEYNVEVWHHVWLWDYIVLTQWNKMYVFWHTRYLNILPAKIKWWELMWEINMSWITTWPHLHYEEWINWENVKYLNDVDYIANPKSINLKAYRGWDYKVFFTRYDLWDVAQNDSTPCIWASGKDLCKLEKSWIKTVAITSDMRKVLNLKRWDKVQLIWDKGCEWIYQVEDEMNKRFRESCIKRPWTNICIKWDLQGVGWACKIIKVQ